jgi:hypothetical protein
MLLWGRRNYIPHLVKTMGSLALKQILINPSAQHALDVST